MASPSLKSSSDSTGRRGSRIAAALSRKGYGSGRRRKEVVKLYYWSLK